MAERGIFIDVLPALDMAAMAAVVTQMKNIFGKAGRDLSQSLDGPTRAVKQMEQAMTSAANAAEQASIRAEKIANRAAVANARYGQRADQAAQKAATGGELNAVDLTALGAVTNANRAAAQAHKEAQQAADKHAEALENHQGAVVAAAGATTKWGAAINTAGMAATAGTAAIIGATANIAGNWEQMMTRLQVAGMVPAGEIKKLSDGLLNLSSSLGVNQKDLANASLMLAKAGDQYKDTAAQMSVLRASIELAKTEGADLTTTVQQMTTSLSDWNMTADQAANAASKIQVAASNAKRPLEEFMGAFNIVEPRASAILDQKTGFNQVLTFMSRGASTGASSEQTGQNLINFIQHMNDPNNPQSAIMGALGLDSNALSEQLMQPNGLMNVLGQLREAMGKVTDNNKIVHLGTHFNNPQLKKIMDEEYQHGLNPQQRATADMLLQAHAEGRDIDPSMRKYVSTARMSGGDFPQWYTNYLKMTGPSQLMRQGIEPDIDLGRLLNKIFGTDSGFQVGSNLMGNPTDPNDPKWLDTQRRYREVTGAQPDKNGDIQGWAKVMDTWKQKLDIFKDSIEKLGEAMGEKFLPTLKTWIDHITGFVNFMNNHQGALSAALGVIKTIAEIWVSTKLIGGLSSIVSKVTTLGGAAATAAGPLSKLGNAAGDAAPKMGNAARGASALAANLNPLGIALWGIANELPGMIHAIDDARHQMMGDRPLNAKNLLHDAFNILSPGTNIIEQLFPTPHGKKGDTPGGPRSGKSWDSNSYFDLSKQNEPTSSSTDNTPDGTKNDPLYVQPATEGSDSSGDTDLSGLGGPPNIGGGGGMGGEGIYNPLEQSLSGKGGHGLQGVVRLMSTFLAELALGNPLGKLETGQVSPYAWWAGLQNGGQGNMDPDAMVANMKNMTDEQLRNITITNNQTKAHEELMKVLQKFGVNSPQGQNALMEYQDYEAKQILGDRHRSEVSGRKRSKEEGELAQLQQIPPALRTPEQNQKMQSLQGQINAAPSGNAGNAPLVAGGINLSTIPVAAQKYANDCIDASARIILSHSGINMTEDQLESVIAPGGTIESQAAGMNRLDPAGRFVPMQGSGGSPAAMSNALRASIANGTGSILNIAPGSSLNGRSFGEGHFVAVTGVNPDGSINVSDTAGGTRYTVSAQDAFQASRGRGIVAGTGSGPAPGLPGYSTGGPVRGSSDTVPAWLTPGEVVMNTGAAKQFGPALNWMNAQGFATGGPVPLDGPTGGNSGGNSGGPSVVAMPQPPQHYHVATQGTTYGPPGPPGPTTALDPSNLAPWDKGDSGARVPLGPTLTPPPTNGPPPTPGPAPGKPAAKPEETTQIGTDNDSKGFNPGGGALGAAESMAQTAISAAGMAADVMGGGGGGSAGAAMANAAMQIGVQEMNRLAGYIGQSASILAVEAPMETFGMTGDNGHADLSKSIFGKIGMGLAGAHPNLPNDASMATQPAMKPGEFKGDKEADPAGAATGALIHIENQNFHGPADNGQVNRDLSRALMANGLPR